MRVLLIINTLALAMAFAGSAQANNVTYVGSGAQTGHPAVLMDFDLRGKNCPRGPDCLKQAKVTRFLAVSYGFPVCSEELLESAFEFDGTMKVKSNRKFSGGGVIPGSEGGSSSGDVVRIEGKFARNGKSAGGTFTVDRGGCLTGTVPWSAVPE